MQVLTRISAIVASVIVAAMAGAQPQYQIFDIGVVQVGDSASQGFGVSPGSGIAVGRSFQSSGTQAFTWSQGGGLVGLPNLAGRSYCRSDSANDTGIVVGTASTTAFGSGRLPVIWQNGVVSQLPLPAGETLGEATGVNAAGVAVGSVDAGSFQRGVIYNGSSATIITQTTTNGSFFVAAFGINNFGRVVGFGIDPSNAARNVGIVYDIGSTNAFEVGALPGFNGAIAFGVSNNGHVVGSSMLNQGSGMPFIYSDALGIRAIPLATGTSEGSARGVNLAGWVVGDDSSAFSIPFLWDGGTTYRIADLLPPGSGWDLDMNTSSSALGISDNGIIVGTGVHNGETHAYALVPVTGSPTPSPTATPTPTATLTPTPTPAIDLGVNMIDSPDPVQVGQNLTYTITVFNNVPDTALGVTMTDALPPGVNFVSATPSQGSCTGTTTVTCNLGTIPGSDYATVVLVVTPTVVGQITNTAVAPYPGDPNPSNNSSTQVTTAIPAGTPTPTPSIAPTPTSTPTPVSSPTPGAQALNLSTRMRVQAGDNVGIGGFIITGNDPKRVIVRAIGPSLGAAGIPDALADPVMELHGPGGFVTLTNDNWRDTQEAEIIATGIAPTADLESAIVATLNPGAYTAIVGGKNDSSGVALVEVYDLNGAVDSKLANLSTRAFVDTGSNIVIAGFILGNNSGNDRIVVRGIGPSLVGLNALGDPMLELHNGNGALLFSNDNWQDDPVQAAELVAAGLAPTNDLEPALAVTLPPGLYTALLSGVDSGVGIGLVEVYDRGAAPAHQQTNLVSDLAGLATVTDPNLTNPWGIATSPTSPFWVADNRSGLSTTYDGTGTPVSGAFTVPPASGGTQGSPTGIVYNASNDFVVSPGAAARFIFATEDGTISGWAPATGATAVLKVDNSATTAVYKGLAIGNNGTANYLYAANFHAGRIDVFDAAYAPATLTGNFTDPNIPTGYAPFNIQNIGGVLYVSYALQDAAGIDDVPGLGHGFINTFDLNGNLLGRFASRGLLNSPWGMALAPAGFGAFANDLLVGNFGDGRVNVFDPATHRYLGQLADGSSNPVSIEGLWGLQFGNGGNGGDLNTLYFTAGIAGPGLVEDHGLFGSLTAQ